MKSAAGFTLMEVLVALIILSIAFSTVFMSISTNAKHLLYLQNKTAANWVALNVLSDALLHDTVPVSGLTNLLNKDWYWQVIKAATPNPTITRLDIDVKETPQATSLIHVVGYIRKDT